MNNHLTDDAGVIGAADIFRGVRRLLREAGHVSISEAPLGNGRRADILALAAGQGEIVIVEVKSSRADYLADHKWREYLQWCDAFYFALPAHLGLELTPREEGLIIADAWGGEIVRPPVRRKLAAARRRAMTLRFARLAAQRLHRLEDPALSGAGFLALRRAARGRGP